jgi:RimJ/RimL family protein N-acetyltransferase
MPSLLDLPAIETQRLRLRVLTPEDAEAFHMLTDEPAIIAAIDFLQAPFSRADAAALLLGGGDGRDCFWGLWRKGEAALIGTVGSHLRGQAEIEIGYWLAPAVHGRGFGAEAVAAIIVALTTAFPERRIYAECRPQNLASWRLLEKTGFRAEGTGKRAGRVRLALARRPA